MATAKEVCASHDNEPKDMAPVENRFKMEVTDSTSSNGTLIRFLNFNKLRSEIFSLELTNSANCLYCW